MFAAKPFRPLRQMSLRRLAVGPAVAALILLSGWLTQSAKADLSALEPGGYGWLPLTLQPGRYTLRASTFGNVDIELFNAERTEKFNLFVVEANGYDTMAFSVETAEVRYVRYTMMSCYTLWGSCDVDIVLDGPT